MLFCFPSFHTISDRLLCVCIRVGGMVAIATSDSLESECRPSSSLSRLFQMLRPSTASATTAASSSSSIPFSSEGASSTPVTQITNTWNSHTDNLTLLKNMNGISHINAMDQVPFVPHAAYDSSRSSAGPDTRADDIRRCYAVIDRVTGLLAAPSQSEYNFSVERSVIREASASSSWQAFP